MLHKCTGQYKLSPGPDLYLARLSTALEGAWLDLQATSRWCMQYLFEKQATARAADCVEREG